MLEMEGDAAMGCPGALGKLRGQGVDVETQQRSDVDAVLRLCADVSFKRTPLTLHKGIQFGEKELGVAFIPPRTSMLRKGLLEFPIERLRECLVLF